MSAKKKAVLTLLVFLLLFSYLHTVNAQDDDTSGIITISSPPQYSNISVNATAANATCQFSSYWSDPDILAWCCFAHNNTGSWSSNITLWTDGVNTTRWANYTLTLNSTVGQVVGYRWYCNDTLGDMADITQTLTITPAVFRYLEIIATSGGTTDPTPGTHAYGLGSNVTVEAVAEASYQFDYWQLQSVNETVVRVENPLTFTMTANYTLIAYFKVEPTGGGYLGILGGVGGGLIGACYLYYMLTRKKEEEAEELW